MRMKAINKDFVRELWHSKGRFFSILLIVALGVAFFSGVRASSPDMKMTADQFFDDCNLYDLNIIGSLGLTKEDVLAIRDIEGVDKVEAGYSKDVICQSNEDRPVYRIISMQDEMNSISQLQGRLPKSADECVMDKRLIDSGVYQLGDKISVAVEEGEKLKDSLVTNTFTIVGAGISSNFLSRDRGSSSIGDGTLSAYLFVPQSAFSMDVYTNIYVKCKDTQSLLCYSDEYEDRVEKVSNRIEKIKDYRSEQRYNEIKSEAQSKIDKAIKKVDDAKKKIDDGKRKLDKNKAKLSDALAEIEENEAQWTSSSNKLKVTEEKLEKQVDQIKGAQKQYELSKKKLEQEEEGWKVQRTQLVAMQSLAVVEQGDAKILEANRKLAAGKAKIDLSLEKLKEARKEIKLAKAKLQQCKDKLNKARTTYEDGMQKYLNAEKKFDKAKQKANKKITKAERKIQDGQEDLIKLKQGKWYVTNRNYTQSYVEFDQDADRIDAIGTVVPIIFFLVAALVSLTSMTRMVEEERTKIGTLKALGYSRFSIAKKYVMYALLASIIGGLIGMYGGQKIFPFIIVKAYTILYVNLPATLLPLHADLSIISMSITTFCVVFATIIACYKELLSVPAKLMRPAAPKSGKRIFLERLTLLWKHLSFNQKATARNLVRYKKRFFMTVFGIGGCMSLLLVGFGLKDSIMSIVTKQYSKVQLYDCEMVMTSEANTDEVIARVKQDNRVKQLGEVYQKTMKIGYEDKTREAYVVVPKDTKSFQQFVSLHSRTKDETYSLDDKGVMISEKLAKLLGVGIGDHIYINEDNIRAEVAITHIVENYFYHYVYISPHVYEEVMGKPIKVNELLINTSNLSEDEQSAFRMEYNNNDNIDYTQFLSKRQESIGDMLNSLNLVVYVLIISAGLLSFVVLYNLNNINIGERRRELATLKVLGAYDGEVSQYILMENICLTVIGTIVGIGLGLVIHRFVIITAEIDMMMFGRDITLPSYVYSIILTFVFSILINIVMHFKLKKIDMISSLKSVE